MQKSSMAKHLVNVQAYLFISACIFTMAVGMYHGTFVICVLGTYIFRGASGMNNLYNRGGGGGRGGCGAG